MSRHRTGICSCRSSSCCRNFRYGERRRKRQVRLCWRACTDKSGSSVSLILQLLWVHRVSTDR